MLNDTDRTAQRPAANEDEEEEEGAEDLKQSENTFHHGQRKREVKAEEDKQDEKDVSDSDSHQVSEAQMVEEANKEEAAVTESEAPGQAEVSDPHSVLTSHIPSQDAAAAGVECEQEQVSAPEPSTEQSVSIKSEDLDDEPGKNPQPSDGQETHITVSSAVDVKSFEETENKGEITAASQKTFGPPVNPPPPPIAPQNSSEGDTR